MYGRLPSGKKKKTCKANKRTQTQKNCAVQKSINLFSIWISTIHSFNCAASSRPNAPTKHLLRESNIMALTAGLLDFLDCFWRFNCILSNRYSFVFLLILFCTLPYLCSNTLCHIYATRDLYTLVDVTLCVQKQKYNEIIVSVYVLLLVLALPVQVQHYCVCDRFGTSNERERASARARAPYTGCVYQTANGK